MSKIFKIVNTCFGKKKKKHQTGKFNCFCESEIEVIQLCQTPCVGDPMDYRLPGSSVHGIFQARILDWVVISFSRGYSWSRDRNWVSCIVSRLYHLSYQGIPLCEICYILIKQKNSSLMEENSWQGKHPKMGNQNFK